MITKKNFNHLRCGWPNRIGEETCGKPATWRMATRRTGEWDYVEHGLMQNYSCDEHRDPWIERDEAEGYPTAYEPLDDRTNSGYPLLSNREQGERPPRQCFWLDETCVDPEGKGFIPSLVTEGEPGHSPLRGDPAKFQTPWIWGPTIQEAKAQVVEANTNLGLSPDDVTEIVVSSMFSRRNR